MRARARARLDRVVGLPTRYRLDGQDVECRWEQDFLYPPARNWNPTSVLYIWNPNIPGGKVTVAWRGVAWRGVAWRGVACEVPVGHWPVCHLQFCTLVAGKTRRPNFLCRCPHFACIVCFVFIGDNTAAIQRQESSVATRWAGIVPGLLLPAISLWVSR